MDISYRKYKDSSDLDLQRNLWIEATRNLPWVWKPNKSQKWYSEQTNFDHNSKHFAYDGKNSVGYISFIQRPMFIPFGFPWVLPGYEGEIQHHLFDTQLDYCVHELKAASFLQRFRKDWTYHIKFFEEKEFLLDWSNPIFVFVLSKEKNFYVASGYEAKIHSTLPEKAFLDIAKRDKFYNHIKDRNFAEYINYYKNDIDIDWYVEVRRENEPVGLSMVTIREDTKYVEIVGLFSNSSNLENFHLGLQSTMKRLQENNNKVVSITLEQDSPKFDLVKENGFELRSEFVFYSKKYKSSTFNIN